MVAWGSAALIAADRDNLTTISHAIAALPPRTGDPRPVDLILEGCASLVVDGRATAIPILQRAAAVIADLTDQDILKWGWQAAGVSSAIWDDQLMLDMYTREVDVLRAAGALTELPIHLISLGVATSWSGDFAVADAIVAEADLAAAATGIPLAPNAKMMLSALRGLEADAWPLIATTIEQAGAARQLMGVTCANWAAAILYNGLARYHEAMKAALVCTQIAELWVSIWALPGLIEAAVRIDEQQVAATPSRDWLMRPSRATRIGRTGSWLARGRCSMKDRTPTRSTTRRFNDWAGQSYDPSSPVPTWCMASGYAAEVSASMQEPNCELPTRCSLRSAWKPSPSEPAANCSPPGKPSESVRPRRRPVTS